MLYNIGRRKNVITRQMRMYKNKKEFISELLLSGYKDSNLGPPAPKAGALTGLRYTPRIDILRKS